MEYKIGQAVMITFSLAKEMLFIYQENKDPYVKCTGLIYPNDSATVLIQSTRPATEAEILAEIQKHGWKQKTSKWLYASPSGQLELMNNDSWQPIIHRSPLHDQFEFFGNECIQAARISKALNLANV
jgi:hypothetical protein